MQDNLVIVESPAKAKTIEKFLGKDYKVMSSYGHIRDLKKSGLSINEKTFEPDYEIPEDKKKVVAGSHPMRIAKEKPSAGTSVRCSDSMRKRLRVSSSMRLPSLLSFMLSSIHVIST